MENKTNNKKVIVIVAAILVVLAAVFAVVWIVNRPATGKGAKAITVEVKGSDGKTTDYKLNTDEEFLKGAMDELAGNGSGFSYSGSESDFGIMVEVVNGERALYAEDGAYWALYVNQEYGQYGADSQPVTDGDTYSWVYESAQ